jgi:superfamily II DNA or RNA helicase
MELAEIKVRQQTEKYRVMNFLIGAYELDSSALTDVSNTFINDDGRLVPTKDPGNSVHIGSYTRLADGHIALEAVIADPSIVWENKELFFRKRVNDYRLSLSNLRNAVHVGKIALKDFVGRPSVDFSTSIIAGKVARKNITPLYRAYVAEFNRTIKKANDLINSQMEGTDKYWIELTRLRERYKVEKDRIVKFLINAYRSDKSVFRNVKESYIRDDGVMSLHGRKRDATRVINYIKLVDGYLALGALLANPNMVFSEGHKKLFFNDSLNRYNLSLKNLRKAVYDGHIKLSDLPEGKSLQAFSLQSIMAAAEQEGRNKAYFILEGEEIRQLIAEMKRHGAQDNIIFSTILALYRDIMANLRLEEITVRLDDIITSVRVSPQRRSIKNIIRAMGHNSEGGGRSDRFIYKKIIMDIIRMDLNNDFGIVSELDQWSEEFAAGSDFLKMVSEILQEIKKSIVDTTNVKVHNLSKQPTYYQKEGILFLTAADKRILSYDTGLGKTVVSIAAINRLKLGKVIWVTTLSALMPLYDELLSTELGLRSDEIYIVSSNWNQGAYDRAKYILINYEKLRSQHIMQQLSIEQIPLLILDEAHLLDKDSTIRSFSARSLGRGVDRIWMLTASLYQSDTHRVFYLLNILQPDKFVNYRQFKDDFPATAQGLSALRDTVLDKYMLRLNKNLVVDFFEPAMKRPLDEQLLQSPKIAKMVHEKFRFELTREQIDLYLLALTDFEAFKSWYNSTRSNMEIKQIVRSDFFTQYQFLLRIIYDPVSVGISENPSFFNAVDDWVKHKLSQGEQVIIWGWNVGPLTTIEKKLRQQGASVGLIYGPTSVQDRNAIMNDFNSGKIDILVANFESFGVSVNLPAATSSLFIQAPSTFASFYQTMGRCQRIVTIENKMYAKEMVFTGVLIPQLDKNINIVELLFDKLQKSEGLYYFLMDNLVDSEVEGVIKNYIKQFLQKADGQILKKYLVDDLAIPNEIKRCSSLVQKML